MALVRPSLILQELLTEESYSTLAEKEIKRSFIYIAQSDVKKLSPEQSAEGNIMRLCIRLMKPYWDANNPEAEVLWQGVMPKWLDNISRNLSTAMRAYNSVIHPFGIGRIAYQWADFEFDSNMVLRLRLVSNAITSDIPAIASHVRKLCAAGTFGSDPIARIRIPSLNSYEAQMAQDNVPADEDSTEEAAIEAELQDFSAVPQEDQAAETRYTLEAAAARNEQVAPFDAEDTEDIEDVTNAEDTQDALKVSEDGVEEAIAENEEADYGEDSFDFEEDSEESQADSAEEEHEDAGKRQIGQEGAQARGLPDSRERAESLDFSIWGIEYADGTVVEFDSITDTFLA